MFLTDSEAAMLSTNCELSPVEDDDSIQAKRRDQVGQQLDQHRDCCVPGVILFKSLTHQARLRITNLVFLQLSKIKKVQ